MIKSLFSRVSGICLFSFLFFSFLFMKGGNSLFSFNVEFNLSPLSTSFTKESGLSFFHDFFLMSWLVGITVGVLVILLSVELIKETSNSLVSSSYVEVLWIFLPSLILLGIGIPSLEILYLEEDGGEGVFLSLKTTAYQWFWVYELSSFSESYMGGEEGGFDYLFSEDFITVPKEQSVMNFITSGDVMHSWTLPLTFSKADAIPGRMNSLLLNFFSMEGEVLLGQCSELCGANHSFMPIVLGLH